MARTQAPVTSAVRALREAGVAFEPHLYAYEDKGGTRVSARELGVDEHQVIKTLVMQADDGEPLIILMHGDLQVSTKELARQLGHRRVAPCDPATAEKHTGYQVGGTSPFGTRRPLPVYVQRTVLELPRIYINGGKRGFLVSMHPSELSRVLGAEPVDAAQ
ncbi:MAG: Cys-tRNA(Pro) deacylase [Deltaproteobacteria bacterium]|nr:Cys-tRNA(Pro) deacylase [Deltaproteobacteria bacterium]